MFNWLKRKKYERCQACGRKIKGEMEVMWFEVPNLLKGTKDVVGVLIHKSAWCEGGALVKWKQATLISKESEL